MLYLLLVMRILQLFTKVRKKKKVFDSYQQGIERLGSEQLRKLVEKGLSIPIALR